MYIRIGFNYGEVIREANDVHGDVVNVAARITEVARARQTLATQAAVDALTPELRHRAHHIRRASIKGRQAQLDLFQIGWHHAADRERFGNPAQRKPEGLEELLFLRHRDQHFTVSARNPSASLGRGKDCAIVIGDDVVAERHAVVEYQLGKFFVSDRSAGGTYIHFDGGETAHITDGDTLLRGSGEIMLGRPFSEDAEGIIEFSIRLTPAPD